MKKIFSYLAAAAMLFAASCSNEDLGTNNANDTQVTFNLSLEGQSGTRAIGEGTSVDKLYFAVYGQNVDGTFTLYPDASVNAAKATDKGTKGVAFNGTYNLRLKLAKDQTYKIVFWAQKDQPQSEEYYTFDFANGKLTVNYDVDGNIEARDAFYFADSYTIKGSESINVVLTRPFAQLNVGVTKADYDAAVASGVTITQSKAVVTGVYNTLNLLDGTVSNVNFNGVATFAKAATPKAASETLKVKVNGVETFYEYLSMNYILVGKETSQNVAAEFEFYSDNGKKIDFKSGLDVVPVQRNYRTNLVGQILTGNLDFEVKIDANFKGNENVTDAPSAVTIVENVAGLQSAIEKATEPTTIYLKDGSYEFSEITIPSGKSIYLATEASTRAAGSVELNGQFFVTGKLQIDGMTISNEKASSKNDISKKANNAIYVQGEGEVVVLNSTFNIVKATGITSWWSTGEQTNVIVKNCVFNCNGNRPLQIEANATIENCTFNDQYRYCVQLTSHNAVINFKNNTINQAYDTKLTYGVLLTSDYGNSNLVINGEGNVINDRGADDALYVWETGTGISNGVVDIETITFNVNDGLIYMLDGDKMILTINSAAEMFKFAELVNNGKTFANAEVHLTKDIDLQNAAWTPIGLNADNVKKFNGTFDGKGKTIKNLNVNTEAGYTAAGLFGALNGTVKNLTIDGAQIKHISTGGATDNGIAVVAGSIYSKGEISEVTVKNAKVEGNRYMGGISGYTYGSVKNCKVENIELIATPNEVSGGYDNGDKVGGVVGYFASESVYVVSGNTATNVSIKGYRDLGGIVGSAGGADKVTSNEAKNITIIVDQDTYFYEEKDENAGAIVGRITAGTLGSKNKTENVTIATAISTVDGLKKLATKVNGGNTYQGRAVVLTADLDLNNEEWTPIGNSTNKFQGTFDGQNHTVKNLVITGNKSDVGLFGFTTNGEIKNLTVENAKVSGRLYVAVVAGTPYTSKYTNITVKGHVEVNGMAYVGGVGGKNAYANWTNVTVDVDGTSYVYANSVENGTAYRTYVGGVTGFNGEGGHTFTNIKSNINVKGTTCDIGGLFGIAHYGNNFVNCTCSGNVEITNAAEAADAEEIGGIAGVWHNQDGTKVTFDGCSFTGKLISNITEGVDLSDNTITGKAYNATGTGELIIK